MVCTLTSPRLQFCRTLAQIWPGVHRLEDLLTDQLRPAIALASPLAYCPSILIHHPPIPPQTGQPSVQLCESHLYLLCTPTSWNPYTLLRLQRCQAVPATSQSSPSLPKSATMVNWKSLDAKDRLLAALVAAHPDKKLVRPLCPFTHIV